MIPGKPAQRQPAKHRRSAAASVVAAKGLAGPRLTGRPAIPGKQVCVSRLRPKKKVSFSKTKRPAPCGWSFCLRAISSSIVDLESLVMRAKALKEAQVRSFRRRLLRWFDREQRVLPWRGETDPYRILVSEIMLQQTRVAVVEQRYGEFLKQFPTVVSLARAREQTVLAAWSGLGYYRRARALHAAAKTIHRQRSFPKS